MDTKARRRLAAIVAADVAGFSRLVDEDEEATLAALQAHRRELLEPLLDEYAGRIANTAGDSLLLEFASAVDAVRWAMAAQQGLRERNRDIPEVRRIRFRIGINVGDVVADGPDLLGDGVNIAARLEGLAEPGGICLSRAVRDQVRDRLDLTLADLGEVEVKNIARPVRVFRIQGGGASGTAGTTAVRRWTTRRGLIAAGVLAVTLLVGLVAGLFLFTTPDIEPADPAKFAFALPEQPSIAVLLFETTGSDEEEHVVAKSLSESIIGVLSTAPELLVIARDSAFTFKDRSVPVREVAERLGVRYVLDGSVLRADGRLRINAQLIDALNGRYVWVHRYDRDYQNLSDLFDVQDDIALSLLEELHVSLSYGSVVRREFRKISDLDSLRDLGDAIVIFQRWSPVGNHEAERLFEALHAKHPDYLYIGAMRGWVLLQKVLLGVSTDPPADLAKARQYAEAVLEKDENFPFVHTVLATLDLLAVRHDDAVEHVERIVALDPNGFYPSAGWVLMLSGKPEDAERMLRRQMRRQPYHFQWVSGVLGWALVRQNRLEEAEVIFQAVLAASVDDRISHPTAAAGLTTVAALRKDWTTAREHLKSWQRLQPGVNLAGYVGGLYFERDRAFVTRLGEALRRAGLPLRRPGVKPIVAVLPFTNLSDEREQKHIADGLAEDLIVDLSKLESVSVIARNSAFHWRQKDPDAAEVIKSLGADHLITGTVRRRSDHLQINVKLIEAQLGQVVWAERFEGRMQDVFAIRDRIIGAVLEALAIALTQEDRSRLKAQETSSVEAYEAYLRGWQNFLRRTPAGLRAAVGQFETAIDLDPNYARAWAALAATYHESGQRNWNASVGIDIRRYPDLMAKALRNPTPLALRLAAETAGYDEPAVMRFLDRAERLEPGNAETILVRALMKDWFGDANEALRLALRSIRLNPLPTAHDLYVLGRAQYSAGNAAEAVDTLNQAHSRNPEDPLTLAFLAAAQVSMGDQAAARKSAATLKEQRSRKGRTATGVEDFRLAYAKTNAKFVQDLQQAGLTFDEGRSDVDLSVAERLTGDELARWNFDVRIEALVGGGHMAVERNAEGESKHFWNGRQTATSVDRLVDDEIVIESDHLNPKVFSCRAYRNRQGNRQALNEFIAVCDHITFAYAVTGRLSED